MNQQTVNQQTSASTGLGRTLHLAKSHSNLRAFAQAFERQTEELESFYDAMREAGNITLQISAEWMEQFEDTCRPASASLEAGARMGTRC